MIQKLNMVMMIVIKMESLKDYKQCHTIKEIKTPFNLTSIERVRVSSNVPLTAQLMQRFLKQSPSSSKTHQSASAIQ
jgi:hypothetical protein